MRKEESELLHRLEHLSLKMESTLHSARDANNVLIEERRRKIKEFLSKSFEEKDHAKTMGDQIANLILCGTGAMLSGDWGRKLGEADIEIMKEHKIDKNNLRQKFDHAINKIDSMSAIRLNQIMRILKKYNLERILDTINAECIEATVLRKRDLKIIL